MVTVLKLGPMLTSEKRAQVDRAIVLLDGLASDKAVDSRVADQVKALVQSTLTSGLKRSASVEEKLQAEAIIAFADRAQLMNIQAPGSGGRASTPTLQSAVSAAIDNSTLPVRVYVQIASEEDRPMAMATSDSLRTVGLIVPGVELVPARSAPQRDDLRYCDGKVDENALERVKSALAAGTNTIPTVVVLDAKLCGKVRFNHFELWYARRGA
ncbi:MAG: hypothetical protein ACKVQT_14810 [Burkholderiales bacterium]